MSDKKFDKAEYDRQYYQRNKGMIKQRRVQDYGKRHLEETISRLDVDQQLKKVLEMLKQYDEHDLSPENNLRFKQTCLYAKMLMTIKYTLLSPEDKEKVDLEQLLHIPQSSTELSEM